ncbi:MAG: hypothetical protein IOD12_00985 [Silvanigrellales bacterium]|nr:hypothetical protein [Silvanigrellales bacterium]
MRRSRSKCLCTVVASLFFGLSACNRKLALEAVSSPPVASPAKETGKKQEAESRYLALLRKRITLARSLERRLAGSFRVLEKSYGVKWTESFATSLGETLAATAHSGAASDAENLNRAFAAVIEAVVKYTDALSSNPPESRRPPDPAELVKTVFEAAQVPFPRESAGNTPTPVESPSEGAQETQGVADALALSLAAPTMDGNCAVRFLGTVTGTEPAGASFAADSGFSGLPATVNAGGLSFALPFSTGDGSHTAQWNILDSLGQPLSFATRGFSVSVLPLDFALLPPSLGMEAGRQRPMAAPAGSNRCVSPGPGRYAQIVSGHRHTCALSQAGGVKCWGENQYGQLGDGTTADRSSPVDVPGLSNVTGLATGYNHTCAVTQAGGVKCWGLNISAPADVPGLADVVSLAAGASHTCAVTKAGGVKCWGQNGAGELGDGTTTPRSTPVDVPGLAGIAGLAAGYGHTCAVTQAGGVKCWGYNGDGRLGDGTTAPRSTVVDVVGLTNVTSLAAGWYFTCAATQAGHVKCWGDNSAGQLGDGTTLGRITPVDVPGLEGITSLSAARWHTCALTHAGNVKCWGDNALGQLGSQSVSVGNAKESPVGLPAVTRIVTGSTSNHTCAVTPTGTVKCWGDNSAGQLGDGLTTWGQNSLPGDVPGLADVEDLGLGLSHTCALTQSHGVTCWGGNFYGQLGVDPSSTPVSASPLSVAGVSDVDSLAVGASHTCAASQGSVKCWGRNDRGQLGDGNVTTDLSVGPVVVGGLSSDVVVMLSAGESHTCALLQTGAVKCWGKNDFGQLGNGDVAVTESGIPLEVMGLSDVASLSAGSHHTCALMQTTGEVKCWGRNDFLNLGDGTGENSSTPVDVPGLTGIARIAAGGSHTCAVTQTGGVKCWGSGLENQIGAEMPIASTPVDVPGLASVEGIMTGANHTCALMQTTGEVKCWGMSSFGQLGWLSQSLVPVVVDSMVGIAREEKAFRLVP